ncbi:MAG: ABC transporter permease [Calditrichaeota bacterium]|nr:MAG: ABC transporter permease [Calditrichota bacterium]MBL1205428.1 ABC transporter permease [Calditrichota bacterium]NOG45257.1 ABC transporter permease [Calditrichota bacterium]
MNFWFTIREGLKGFSRARLSTFITITSIVFSLFLIAIFLVLSINVDSWIGQIRSKLELEVYIDRTSTDEEAKKTEQQIAKIDGIEKSVYISKEAAAKRFEKEFGKNIYEILQNNPLPASIIITLKPGFRNAEKAAQISNELGKVNGVEEIVYHKELISIIDNYLDIVYLIGAIIIILLITITFILLYNTIRLTIYARRDIIEIMKLVGAKKSLIKRPFVIEGLLQGVFGALIASGAIYFSVKLVIKFLYPFLLFKADIYFIVIIMGMLIGYFSSRISVQKHLSNV